MKNRMLFLGGLVALVLAALAILASQRDGAEVTRVDANPPPAERQLGPRTSSHDIGTDRAPPASHAHAPGEPAAEIAPEIEPSDEDDPSEDPAKMFKADAAGNLALRERTRLNLEKLSALYTPDELRQRLATIEQALPATAYGQLIDLMARYENFTRDSRQALPPGRPATTVEDAIAQHETLHALRVAHFGAEAAEAMYGREERIGRQLLEFMSLEQHEGLTMEEKAMRAQDMLLRSPELRAAYEKNRTAPANTQ